MIFGVYVSRSKLAPWKNILHNVQLGLPKDPTCSLSCWKFIRKSRLKRQIHTMANSTLWRSTSTCRISRSTFYMHHVFITGWTLRGARCSHTFRNAKPDWTPLERTRLYCNFGHTRCEWSSTIGRSNYFARSRTYCTSISVGYHDHAKSIAFAQLEQQVLDAVLAT